MYLQATPTLLRRFGSQLIKSTVLSTNTSLRILALGGEAFPSLTVLKSWRGVGNKTQIFNIYGITEVSSWATFYRIPEKILNSTLKYGFLLLRRVERGYFSSVLTQIVFLIGTGVIILETLFYLEFYAGNSEN